MVSLGQTGLVAVYRSSERAPIRWAGGQEIALCAAIGAGVAALAWWIGPPGTDTAAHAYLIQLYEHHGLVAWDNFWYDGRYPFYAYSVAYYPLAALVGMVGVAIGAAAVFGAAIALSATVLMGRKGQWAARTASLCFGLFPLSGAYPYEMGMAAGAALLAVAAWSAVYGLRWWVGPATFLLASLTVASSALAYLFCILGTWSAIVSNPKRLRRFWLLGGLALLPGLADFVVYRAFSDYGMYPFWWQDFLEVEVACAVVFALASPRLRGADQPSSMELARSIRVFCVAIALVALVAFLVPTDLGANLAQVRDFSLGALVAVLGLAGPPSSWSKKRRMVSAMALAAGGWWNLGPFVGALPSLEAARWLQSPKVWAPVVDYLHRHLGPSWRVEAVDTAGHWPALGLAGAGIPLVRGWFRQDDFPWNQLLYQPGPLKPSSYLAWLRSQGVAYVVVTNAPPDFSSANEKSLVLSGRTGLRKVFSADSGRVVVYAVPHPTPIASGGAQIVQMGVDALDVYLPRPGIFTLSLHWSPYWQASSGCVARTPSGMISLTVARVGEVHLAVRPSWQAAWRAVLGEAPISCKGLFSTSSAVR